MLIKKPKPFVIQCDSTQLKITSREYVICQNPTALNLCHLGFTALLSNKISILVFTSPCDAASLSFEFVDGKYRVFPNGRRDLACQISKWEIEAIDGLIMDCLLGKYSEEVNIDTELSSIYGRVDFVFMISDFFL